MNITADTNVLVRIVTRDDDKQARMAYSILSAAGSVALPLPCLCELVWVLERVYGLSKADLALAIRTITSPGNTVFDDLAVDAGLRVLEAGGDFADGVIASAGLSMGADMFVSFDRKAIAKVTAAGLDARNAASMA